MEAAEKYLNHAALTNFTTFIKMLSDVLVQGGNSQVARMAAGLQLKNHLTSKDLALKQQYQQRWLTLPEDIRLYIKKNVNIIFYLWHLPCMYLNKSIYINKPINTNKSININKLAFCQRHC